MKAKQPIVCIAEGAFNGTDPGGRDIMLPEEGMVIFTKHYQDDRSPTLTWEVDPTWSQPNVC